MSAPLDELYLTWLYSQVGSVKLRTKSRTYWSLLRQLYTKEFVWFVRNDDNRVEDGRDIRREFIESQGLDADPDWMDLGCSMLELFISLARVLAFETDGDTRVWFWKMIDNIGLTPYTDAAYNEVVGVNEGIVDAVLDRVIHRRYSSSGAGGIFPLEYAREDQTQVELWYQMNAYLLGLL